MRYSVNVTEDSSGDIELSVVSMATVQTSLPSGLIDITIDWVNNDIYWTINGTTSFQVSLLSKGLILIFITDF